MHFLGKIELVSKKAVFFFPELFFFSRSRIWVSKYGVNFSRGKKKQPEFGCFFFPVSGKKKTKFPQNELVSRPQTFPRKKKIRYLCFYQNLYISAFFDKKSGQWAFGRNKVSPQKNNKKKTAKIEKEKKQNFHISSFFIKKEHSLDR